MLNKLRGCLYLAACFICAALLVRDIYLHRKAERINFENFNDRKQKYRCKFYIIVVPEGVEKQFTNLNDTPTSHSKASWHRAGKSLPASRDTLTVKDVKFCQVQFGYNLPSFEASLSTLFPHCFLINLYVFISSITHFWMNASQNDQNTIRARSTVVQYHKNLMNVSYTC